ncbi:MAG: HAD family hydrolase [Nanoarchaeota archaeon]|nr:HAD family hydrolase [Nanoarchaeota archaeon]
MHLIFDVDGTLYNKSRDYKGNGTILDSHEFMRYATYVAALNRCVADEVVAGLVLGEYNRHVEQGSLLEAIAGFSSETKEEYSVLVEKHGSNGNVFVNEFGSNSGYLSEMLSHIDFKEVLDEDYELQKTISYLKQHHTLGIFTSEVYSTVESVFEVLGLDLTDFSMILTAEDVVHKKPGREGFDRVLQLTGQPSVNVNYIGDHLTKDVKAPLALGMRAIHVTWKSGDIKGKRVVPNLHGCYDSKSYIEIPTIYNLTEIF